MAMKNKEKIDEKDVEELLENISESPSNKYWCCKKCRKCLKNK